MNRATIAIVVALITAIGSAASALIQTMSNKRDIDVLEANSAGTVETGQKLCSAVEEGNWRDSFIVPKLWNADTCRAYAGRVSAHSFQLGCIFQGATDFGQAGTTYGGMQATPPPKNCGW